MQKRMQQLIARGASPQEMADFVRSRTEEAYEHHRRTAMIGMAIGAAVLVFMSLATFAAAASALLSNAGSSAALSTAGGLGVASLVTGIVGALLARNALALRPPPKELATTGIGARLTVRDYRQASGGFQLQSNGSSVAFQRVAIDLDVAPAEGAPYTVTVREHLAMGAFMKLAPGAKRTGYVDRARPDRIFIDWQAGSGA